MGEVLGALQAWYAAHCDGDWEQEFGVTIGTMQDAGWELRVDLVGTSPGAIERRLHRPHDLGAVGVHLHPVIRVTR